MATLNQKRIQKKKQKRRVYILVLTFVELLLCPLLTYVSYQVLVITGKGSFDLSHMNYSYLTAIKLLITEPKLQQIALILEFLYVAILVYFTVTAEQTISKVDTVLVTHNIETPIKAGNGQHGNERFMNEKEKEALYEKFVFTGKEKTLPGKGGIVVHFQKEKGKEIIYYIGKNLHTLITGSTGSGKTRRILFETIWLQILSGLSVIVSDVKGEIFYYTEPFAKKMGYRTIVFDLRNPKKSDHYNFLKPILDSFEINDSAKAIDYTWDLVSVLVGEQKGEPLWYNGETATLAAAILIVCLDAPNECRNLANVYYFIAYMCEPDEFGEMH